MIILTTGLPGSGKSLFTLSKVNDLAIKENRQVYYHGIPELTLNWILLDDPKEWHKLPSGSIIVIDECQSTFRPRGNGSAVPEHVAKLETHRHNGFDIFLITQHPMLIDGNVRRLVGRHYHSIRFYGFQKSTVHEFGEVRDNVDKSQKGSIANHFVYPKEVYSWYKSADLHTVKKRLPMRLFLIVLLPILLITIIYFMFIKAKDIQDLPTTTQQKNGLIQTNFTEGAQLQTTQNKPMTYAELKQQYITQHQPLISDIPHSAPIYDEVTKPTTAPVISACVESKSNCKCFSQQGTALYISDATCKHFVRFGQFQSFDPYPDKQQNSQVSQSGVSGGAPPDASYIQPMQIDATPSRASPNNS